MVEGGETRLPHLRGWVNSAKGIKKGGSGGASGMKAGAALCFTRYGAIGKWKELKQELSVFF